MDRYSTPRSRIPSLAALLAVFALVGCDQPGEIDVSQAALEPADEEVLADIAMPAPSQNIPPTVTAYAVDQECERIPLASLRHDLDIQGQVQQVSGMTGMKFLVDGTQRLTMYPDGTVSYVDQQYVAADSPVVQPVPVEELFDHGIGLLDELGALDDAYVTLVPEAIKPRFAGQNELGDPALTHQTATYRQRVDFLPAQGPGAVVEIVYPGDLIPAAFHHSMRCLQPDQADTTLTPAEAVVAWKLRADNGGDWSLLGDPEGSFEGAEVLTIELGHYIPATGEAAPTIEPMYKISGVAFGVGTGGVGQDVPFFWYEPAIPGRPMPPSLASL